MSNAGKEAVTITTGGGGVRLTVELADLLESATLVAVTVAVVSARTTGAV